MTYGHRGMGPCHGPAPQDISGAKLNRDSLKYDKVKEAMLHILNSSLSPEHKTAVIFPGMPMRKLPVGKGSNQAQEILPKATQMNLKDKIYILQLLLR